MRWDNLTIEQDEAAALPGYRDPAQVRRFDAPEALDTRFYEVRAKSVLNRVPERSRMPFRWTINPYRGCSHACVYCLDGATPILMADGRHRPLAEIRPGDIVYGVSRRGRYQRYVPTTVTAQWASIKPAYRIRVSDGTTLIASADHRFLTHRGWRHVTGRMAGPGQRPYLTLDDRLVGVGRFAAQPEHDHDYRLGYVTGMVRGDGTLGSSTYERRGGRPSAVHRFRVALVDVEPLVRTRAFLESLAVPTEEFVFAEAAPGRQRAMAMRTSKRELVERVRHMISWPAQPSPSWQRGFLAGIFDAKGSYSRGILRIHNSDAEIIDVIVAGMQALGFETSVDARPRGGVLAVRPNGGLPEHLRFFHTTDPAATRKRIIDDGALKSGADLRVEEVEPLAGPRVLYDLTTGTGNFIADGVVSHNCFARPTHTYLGFGPGRDFEREIVVKVNAPEVARAELSRPRWARERVAMGTNTDPYQWVESKYRLMPGIWEALRDSATPSSVLSKSPLLLRDADLMVAAAERAPVLADLSIPTWDERAWRATEPHTPSPRARMEAVAELNRRGIPTGVLVAPLMPGINDAPEQIAPLLEAAADAGAVQIGGIGLHLRGETRGVFLDWLRSERPDLLERYEELYDGGAYLPTHERRRLARLIRTESRDPSPFSDLEGTARFRAMQAARERAEPAHTGNRPAPEGAQASLF